MSTYTHPKKIDLVTRVSVLPDELQFKIFDEAMVENPRFLIVLEGLRNSSDTVKKYLEVYPNSVYWALLRAGKRISENKLFDLPLEALKHVDGKFYFDSSIQRNWTNLEIICKKYLQYKNLQEAEKVMTYMNDTQRENCLFAFFRFHLDQNDFTKAKALIEAMPEDSQRRTKAARLLFIRHFEKQEYANSIQAIALMREEDTDEKNEHLLMLCHEALKNNHLGIAMNIMPVIRRTDQHQIKKILFEKLIDSGRLGEALIISPKRFERYQFTQQFRRDFVITIFIFLAGILAGFCIKSYVA